MQKLLVDCLVYTFNQPLPCVFATTVFSSMSSLQLKDKTTMMLCIPFNCSSRNKQGRWYLVDCQELLLIKKLTITYATCRWSCPYFCQNFHIEKGLETLSCPILNYHIRMSVPLLQPTSIHPPENDLAKAWLMWNTAPVSWEVYNKACGSLSG